MDKLNLTKKSVYALWVSVNERSSSIAGYYRDRNIAEFDAKGAGWYGSDGDVKSSEIYEDEKGNIFRVEELGKYTDVDREYRKEAIEKIRSKLTDAEIELLGI